MFSHLSQEGVWFRVTGLDCNAVAATCDGFVPWIPITFCFSSYF